MRKILDREAVIALFRKEFEPIRAKFETRDLLLEHVWGNDDPPINKPGVYVFWTPSEGVIKVGRSLSNSKSRAWQHFRDNTRIENYEMSNLKQDKEARLLLFNVRHQRDLYWVLSVEAFLESEADPLIPSGRIG